jgi:hypothetical protein
MDKPPGRDSTRRRHRPNTPTRPGRNGGSRGLGRHERGSHQREHESRRHGSRRCDHRRSGHRQNLQNDLRQNDLHLRGLRLHLEPGPSSELLRHHPEGQLPESSSLLFEPSKSPSPFFEVSRSLHALFFCARNECRPAPFGALTCFSTSLDLTRRLGYLERGRDRQEPIARHRSHRHDFRLVPGEFRDRLLAHVQVLSDHCRRGTGHPVGQ